MRKRRRLPTRVGRQTAVFVALAGGMAGTAALLSWMDPGWPAEPHNLSPERLLQLARTAVFESTTIDPNHWYEVEVFAGPVVPSRGTLLSAADSENAHFIVDADGRLVRMRGWAAQKSITQAPNTVRVQVSASTASAGLSLAQWSTLRALTEALNQAVSKDLVPLPVYIQPDLNVLSARPPTESRDEIPRRLAG